MHLSSQVVELIRQKRDMLLLNEVETTLRLARYSPGRIEFEPAPGCQARPCRAAGPASARLDRRALGGVGCLLGGAPTIAETRDRALAEVRADAAGNPLVQAILAAFPGARITDVRSPETLTAAAAEMALPPAEPEMDDDWDPFEE
jgi:DNA polymerase III subunit gamma/tau